MKKMMKKMKEQRGAEMLQVVLVSGVLLVLVVTVFYPQMQALFNTMMTKITNWFNNSSSAIFTA